MTIFSKVLTLNKIHIIEKIIGTECTAAPSSDYFNIGVPIENPPLLRGSIVIEMNITFLTDNINAFEMGSPIDTGSLKFGFLNPGHDKDLFLQMINCDYKKFHALTLELFDLPTASLKNLIIHRACTTIKPVLEKYFSPTVIDFMYLETNPHAWLFEFSLNQEYTLTEKHIERIFIPNTYLSNRTITKLKRTLKNKLVTYNPKYGIESRT